MFQDTEATISKLGVLRASGVRIAMDDLTITVNDGTVVNVEISSATSVGQVIDAINTAGAGKTMGKTAQEIGDAVKRLQSTGAKGIDGRPSGST